MHWIYTGPIKRVAARNGNPKINKFKLLSITEELLVEDLYSV